jgi:phosphoglycerate dehydrogenase-like enzyme
MSKVKVLIAHQDVRPGDVERVAACDARVDVAAALYLNGAVRQMVGPEKADAIVAAQKAAGRAFDDLLSDAEVLFAVWLPDDVLKRAPKLKWIHVPGAGIDQLRPTGVLEAGVRVSNSSGLNSRYIAEFVMGYMLMQVKRMRLRLERQARAQWVRDQNDTLEGKTIGIIGPGQIGSQIAAFASAFGMRVLAARRTVSAAPPPGVEKVYPMAELGQMLPQCDFVVVTVNLSAETRGLIGAREFAQMKPGAYFMNVARGPVVDQDAMVEVLRGTHLAGAALDVFEQEPLPVDNPLWSMPNVFVTPHSSGNYLGHSDKSYDLFCRNLRNYLDGKPLVNEMPPQGGY